ncbi:hypothetical protein MKX01_021911 [Papaver californicum]|nr:hypothetical protein MKX01_021911 [Papaver californicum]
MEGKVGGGAGGEIRRVHIIYFLSRMGRVEHPHLIRVYHLSRNGVHLRDVKRCLSELRGKKMPDSFAWSYKRRYKTGYVWQDLLDDDFITPISDNEYVIKGSEITTLSFDPCFHGEKKGSTLTKPETITSIEETKSKTPDISNGESQFDGEDSGPLDSETSTESNKSIKERNSDDDHQKQRIVVPNTEIEELNNETVNSLGMNENDEITEKQNSSSSSTTSTTSTTSSSSSSSSSSSFNKSKSYSSGGATNVFRRLLSCRATDINDSALLMIHRSSSSSSENCKFENLGGSDPITSGILCNQHQTRRSTSSSSENNSTSKKSNEFGGSQKKVSAAFKPVAEPHCSQCGKGFKPERLHSHMKSCRGLKTGYDFETDQKFSTPFGSFKERNQQGCF